MQKFNATFGADMGGPVIAFVAVMLIFGLAADNFISQATFGSIAFQLPELGLLTLAMLLPLLTGGINLSITFAANLSGLAAAWVLQAYGGVDAPAGAFMLACLAALATGAATGLMTGLAIAFTRAHPILVTLSMMIFLAVWESSSRAAVMFQAFQPTWHQSVTAHSWACLSRS